MLFTIGVTVMVSFPLAVPDFGTPRVISVPEIEMEEGCLSLPHITLNLERYDKIKVVYYNMEGKSLPKPPKPLNGFISRLFQHELDHLNGKLMLESKNILKAQIAPETDEYKNLTTQLMKYLEITSL